MRMFRFGVQVLKISKEKKKAREALWAGNDETPKGEGNRRKNACRRRKADGSKTAG